MVVLIALITAGATTSVLTGLNVGIKRLSQFNMILAFALLLFIMVVGPDTDDIPKFLCRFWHLSCQAETAQYLDWTRRHRVFCTVGQRSIGHGGLLGHLSSVHSLPVFQRGARYESS